MTYPSKLRSWGSPCVSLINWYFPHTALVLNEKPCFNEPGFEESAGKEEGEVSSQDYSETTFILSCKTMVYTLRRPAKHYVDFVAGHFRAHMILEACKAYMEGVKVGCYSGSM
ncbi:hypothetical protein AQUCO_08400008v1 [Aquilegia coerulea]|uniref:UBC core domain-containing protein n=1 Tax=Aquilegia coerulea TaxID=218851 RepID=A0A2G5C6P3_AQUCA|nr:hypothetical protein AQUCO_08400008v1 [Aquilegia coerulea]